MKYIIASDLHGDAACIAALLEAYRRESADRLLLLGDLLGRDSEAADLLNSVTGQIIAVRGNCDRPSDQSRLHFPMWEDTRCLTANGLSLFLTHGHLYDPIDPPPLRDGDIMISGHTHVPASFQRGGVWFLNPGSVSLPRRGSPNSCLVLDKRSFAWKTLDGDIFRELTLD